MKNAAVIGPPEVKYPGSEIVTTKTASHTPCLFEQTSAGFNATRTNSPCFPALPFVPGAPQFIRYHTTGYTKALCLYSGKSVLGMTRVIEGSILKSVPVCCDETG
jgi:hypothetical protein